MHIGPELAAWLSDRQRQAASQALAAEATARWGAHPLFADLRAELDASGFGWRCAGEDQTFKLLFAERR